MTASSIKLKIATDNTGHERVKPCANCSEWLEPEGGFGSERTYWIKPSSFTVKTASSSARILLQTTDINMWPTL